MTGVGKPDKPSRTKRRTPLRRLLLRAFVIVLVAGPLIGWCYEQYAMRRDARRFPPPGQFVHVSGGRRLHYVCSGIGSPLVLFEVSGFSNSMSFAEARAALAQETRVCSYDRMGTGWSDRGPPAIPVNLLASDLGTLLDHVSPRAPAILVASSIGGVPAEFFARQRPDRIAGLVFLDAGNSQVLREALNRRYLRTIASGACGALRITSAIALVRLWDPWQMRRNRSTMSMQSAAVVYGRKPWIMLCAMVRAAQTTVEQFDTLPELRPQIPVTALSADTRDEFLPPALAGWIDLSGGVDALRKSHQQLAERSAHGVWRIVPGSTHLIAASRPHAAVEAVTEMLTLSGTPSTP